MRSNSLDSKLKAKEVELKRHEQEIADQDEVHVWYINTNINIPFRLQKVLYMYKLLKLWLKDKWSSVKVIPLK